MVDQRATGVVRDMLTEYSCRHSIRMDLPVSQTCWRSADLGSTVPDSIVRKEHLPHSRAVMWYKVPALAEDRVQLLSTSVAIKLMDAISWSGSQRNATDCYVCTSNLPERSV